jgi:Fe-S-cluster formation regulator IscX/YfhJ
LSTLQSDKLPEHYDILMQTKVDLGEFLKDYGTTQEKMLEAVKQRAKDQVEKVKE